jgi:MFS family permease
LITEVFSRATVVYYKQNSPSCDYAVSDKPMLNRGTPLKSQAEAEVFLRYHQRWNFVVNMLDGTFFMFGLSFISTIAILPLFVRHLTAAPLAVGLIPAIAAAGGLLPQLFTARHVAGLARNKPFVLLTSAMERFQWWILAPLVLAVDRIGPRITLITFYMLFVWWALGGGLAGTAWQNMIARIFPPSQRGRFFGTQRMLGGLAGVGGTLVATAIIQRWPYPANFALCFFLGGSCLVISYGFLTMTREPAVGCVRAGQVTHSAYMRQLGRLLRTDRQYTRFLAGRSLVLLAAMPIGYTTIYAIAQFGASTTEVGHLAAVLLAAQVASNLLWGTMGDRRGHLWVLARAPLIGGIASVIALSAASIHWLYPACVLFGMAYAGTTIAGINSVLDLAPIAERPMYIGLTGTLIAIPSGIAPLLGGWIIGALGYQVLFVTAAGFALMGYALLRSCVGTMSKASVVGTV